MHLFPPGLGAQPFLKRGHFSMKSGILFLLAVILSACSLHGPNAGPGDSFNKPDEPQGTPSQINEDMRTMKAHGIEEPASVKEEQGSKTTAKDQAPVSQRSQGVFGQRDNSTTSQLSSDKAEGIEDYRSEETPSELSDNRPDQAIFDSALEFCQTSSDLWDQKDTDGAISALDQAYALILTVDLKRSPELLQQVDDLRFTISKRIVEIYSSRHTAVNGYHTAIPMVMNNHVEEALKQLKGAQRSFFLAAYQRSGKYRPGIVKALREAGLPEELSWLPLIESGFKTRALSPARALGMWQFIASTGYKYGLKRGTWVDERMDPEKSTRAAIDYLKELHQIFGDWTTALAAYNCGEGTVLRFIKSQRINYLDNFWDLYERLPRETASYVPKFLATLHIIADPEAHGFQLPPTDDPIPVEKVAVERTIHLNTIASSLSLPNEVLIELNPELRQDATPDRLYEIHLPAGTGLMFLSKMNDMPGWSPPVFRRYTIHKVARGESVYSIAKKYRTTTGAIISLNSLNKGAITRLRPGTNLKIPITTRQSASKQWPASHKAKNVSCPATYQVKKGDTLSAVAKRFGTTVSKIRGLNGLKDNRLNIGQTLILSPKESTKASAPRERTYRVVKGDSPYSIAAKNDISLNQLLRLNNLRADSAIYPGQVLVVSSE